MHVIRLGLPAIVGCLFMLFGFKTIVPDGQSGDLGELAARLHIAVIPFGIGIVLLLAAVATARRTRFGFWLGLAVGVLMAIAGLGAIVAEIPFLQQGGLSASLGGGVMVLAGIWTVLWLAYAWRFSKAKSDFAPEWVAADRRLGVVVSIVVVVAAAMFVGTEALASNAATNAIESDAQARAVVEAGSVEVHVLDAGITPASAAGPATVDRLTIELVLQNPQAYTIAAAPTICLTSQAVSHSPAYKPGMLCWGVPMLEDELRSAFASLAIPQDTTTVTLERRGAGSPCPMGPGPWDAELTFAPVIGSRGDASGGAPGLYSIHATFQVGDASVPPPPSGTPTASEGCLVVSP